MQLLFPQRLGLGNWQAGEINQFASPSVILHRCLFSENEKSHNILGGSFRVFRRRSARLLHAIISLSEWIEVTVKRLYT